MTEGEPAGASRQVVKGWQFPSDVDVPEDTWSRGKAGGEEFWVFQWEGFVDVAAQAGLESVETDVQATGADADGIPYAAVRATVEIGGERYSAIGSVDATENSLSDMVSTAQSRALKRAIRVALGIRKVDSVADEPTAASPPDDFDPDDGHALSDDGDSIESPAVGGGGDDGEW